MAENAGIFQKILVHVVSIICNFIDMQSSIDERFMYKSSNSDASISSRDEILSTPAVNSIHSETTLSWHQTTVISVMEAGGLNWLLGN